MTDLERTISELLSRNERAADQERARQQQRDAEDRKKLHYAQEFDAIYTQIKSMGQMERSFVAWADRQEIDDRNKEITDGEGFFRSLLEETRAAYRSWREEGYEQHAAFDKATVHLTSWIERSYSEKGKGTIFLNHSPAFMHRIRHLSD